MGKLIKNHWARLITLTASLYQIFAAIEGFFWPKIFWDFYTTNLDHAVKPVPILQTVNLVFGIFCLAYEWPIRGIAGSPFHESIEVRLFLLPLFALMASLLYQGMNPALYYMIAAAAYFWAYSEGETVCREPWALPRRAVKSKA